MVHRTHRGQPVHDVRAAADGTHRHTAADHLAERGQIGGHAEPAHRTLFVNTEAAHDLVGQRIKGAPRFPAQPAMGELLDAIAQAKLEVTAAGVFSDIIRVSNI